MSGDLEDFLRRAAARRQQKAAQQKQQAPPQRSEPPQYSDSRTERVVRQVEPEPVMVADVVDDHHSSHVAQLRKIENAKRAEKRAKRLAKREAAKSAEQIASSRRSADAAVNTAIGNPALELIRMLRRPGGVQQAILLREILDRPEHRW